MPNVGIPRDFAIRDIFIETPCKACYQYHITVLSTGHYYAACGTTAGFMLIASEYFTNTTGIFCCSHAQELMKYLKKHYVDPLGDIKLDEGEEMDCFGKPLIWYSVL